MWFDWQTGLVEWRKRKSSWNTMNGYLLKTEASCQMPLNLPALRYYRRSSITNKTRVNLRQIKLNRDNRGQRPSKCSAHVAISSSISVCSSVQAILSMQSAFVNVTRRVRKLGGCARSEEGCGRWDPFCVDRFQKELINTSSLPKIKNNKSLSNDGLLKIIIKIKKHKPPCSIKAKAYIWFLTALENADWKYCF